MATALAKRGAGAAVSQLREAEIGALAQIVRAGNIGVGAALVLGAGLLTLWECLSHFILCDVGDCSDSACDMDGDPVDNRCMDIAKSECSAQYEAVTTPFDPAVVTDPTREQVVADWLACWTGSEEIETCIHACQMNWTDVFSTMVIAFYMLPLGGMLLAFEGTRASTSAESAARRVLEEYFGFMFLYNGRMLCLLFSGMLACGNVSQRIGGDSEFYHLGGLLAGMAAVGTAFLHFAVKMTHPEYDADMISQLERAVLMRGGGGGGDGGSGSAQGGAAAAVAGGMDRSIAAAPGARSRTHPRGGREDIAERAAAAVAAASALAPRRAAKAPPPALPAGGGGGMSPAGKRAPVRV